MAGVLWNTAYYMMGNYIQKLNTKSLVENLTLDYIVKIGLHRLLFSGLNFAFWPTYICPDSKTIFQIGLNRLNYYFQCWILLFDPCPNCPNQFRPVQTHFGSIKHSGRKYDVDKVHIFWEGHKILRNLHLTMVL